MLCTSIRPRFFGLLFSIFTFTACGGSSSTTPLPEDSKEAQAPKDSRNFPPAQIPAPVSTAPTETSASTTAAEGPTKAADSIQQSADTEPKSAQIETPPPPEVYPIGVAPGAPPSKAPEDQSTKNEVESSFVCQTSRTAGLTTFSVEWRPSEIQKRNLPTILLTWNNIENFNTSAKNLPEKLGTGSPLTITFFVIDPSKPSVIELMANDSEHISNFGCTSIQEPTVRLVRKRAPQCGVEEYKLGSGRVCGAPKYNENSGAVCGAPIFKTARSAACGAEEFNFGTGEVCGFSVSESSEKSTDGPDLPRPFADLIGAQIMNDKASSGNLQKQCKARENNVFSILFNRSERFNYLRWERVNDQFNVVCKVERPQTCRNASFGVSLYNSCRAESHGFESFPKCRHESFGIEALRECRNQEFGVELYKECEVHETLSF